MVSKNLMVIDPSISVPEIESFNKIAILSPLKTTYHLPAIHSSKSLNTKIENISGVILMGSAASIHDSYEWIKNIQNLLKKAIIQKVPILGICFGHQLIANMFGGEVNYLWDQVQKKGVRKVQIHENNLLIPATENFLIYSHKEGVTKCPIEFNISASSEMVAIEGMVHKNHPIWTFQTHIEASKIFAKRTGVTSKLFKKTKSYSNAILKSFFEKIKF